MNKAIYFEGNSCSVSVDLFPKMEKHFKENYPLLDFEVVIIQNQPEIAAKHSVFTIPVLIIFFEGKEHYRFVRNFSAREIDEKLNRTYHLMFD